jgi:Tfp pilus assembly protein PilZ
MAQVLGVERRVFERFEAKHPVRLNSREDPFSADVYLRDISAGGVKIITKQKLNPDNEVEFWVDVPDSHGPIHFSGSVVWTKNVGRNVWDAGIRFKYIRLLDCRRLLNFNAAA